LAVEADTGDGGPCFQDPVSKCEFKHMLTRPGCSALLLLLGVPRGAFG
jgi:hypothetical protein